VSEHNDEGRRRRGKRITNPKALRVNELSWGRGESVAFSADARVLEHGMCVLEPSSGR
jgi:hypothetical protein